VTGIRNLKKAGQEFKTWEDYILSAGKFIRGDFGDSRGPLFVDFLIEQQTINTDYYSKLLEDRVKPALFQNDEVGQSKASVSSATRIRTLPL
jgi:hypothetical protein